MHDPRIGRFFAVDPLAPDYPWNSPYAFSENIVINAVELEGLEKVYSYWEVKGGKKTALLDNNSKQIYHKVDWNLYNGTNAKYLDAYYVYDENGNQSYYEDENLKGEASLKMLNDGVKITEVQYKEFDFWETHGKFAKTKLGKEFYGSIKKFPIAVGIALTAGGYASLTLVGKAVAFIDVSSGLDDLTASGEKQETFLTSRMSDKQKAIYSSLKVATASYNVYRASQELSGATPYRLC